MPVGAAAPQRIAQETEGVEARTGAEDTRGGRGTVSLHDHIGVTAVATEEEATTKRKGVARAATHEDVQGTHVTAGVAMASDMDEGTITLTTSTETTRTRRTDPKSGEESQPQSQSRSQPQPQSQSRTQQEPEPKQERRT